jgi:hypothetical protein
MPREFREYVDDEVNPYKGATLRARVSAEMAEQVERLCKLNGWKPSYVVRGGIKKFIDDCSLPPSPSNEWGSGEKI